MDRYLQRKWIKAQSYADADVERWGVGWRVRSSNGGWYYQRVYMRNRKIHHAQCNCPCKGLCKHQMAVAIRLNRANQDQ